MSAFSHVQSARENIEIINKRHFLIILDQMFPLSCHFSVTFIFLALTAQID